MSIQTWKDAFYPVPASEFAHPTYHTELEAVQHALRKWEGLLPENRALYEVRWSNYSQLISDFDDADDPVDDVVEISGNTCSLCVRNKDSCVKCPLFIVRGGVACDSVMKGEEDSPYRLKRHKPEVMVMWLRRAEEYVKSLPDRQYTGGY